MKKQKTLISCQNARCCGLAKENRCFWQGVHMLVTATETINGSSPHRHPTPSPQQPAA